MNLAKEIDSYHDRAAEISAQLRAAGRQPPAKPSLIGKSLHEMTATISEHLGALETMRRELVGSALRTPLAARSGQAASGAIADGAALLAEWHRLKRERQHTEAQVFFRHHQAEIIAAEDAIEARQRADAEKPAGPLCAQYEALRRERRHKDAAEFMQKNRSAMWAEIGE